MTEKKPKREKTPETTHFPVRDDFESELPMDVAELAALAETQEIFPRGDDDLRETDVDGVMKPLQDKRRKDKK